MSEVNPREEEQNAIARIGLGYDGRLLLRKLYRALEDVPPLGTTDGALYENLGKRRFAQELIRELESEHARSRTADDPRPGIGKSPEPIRLERARGARRPVSAAAPTGSGEA